MTSTPKRAWEELGWFKTALTSNSFLEPKALLLFVVPLSLVTSLLALKPQSAEDVLQAVLANAAGFVVAAVIVVGYLLRIRKAGGLSPIVVVLASLLVGGSKAAVTSTLFTLFESGEVRLDLVRVALGALAGLVMVPLTAVIAHALRGFEIERQALIVKTYRLELESLGTRSESEKLRKIRGQIAELIGSLERSRKVEDVTPGELNLLRELVDRLVRPLSHSLYESIEKRFPSFTWRPLLTRAMHARPPAPAMAAVFLFAGPQTLFTFGIDSGLTVFAVAVVTLPLMVWSTFKVTERVGLLNPLTFISLALLAPAASVLIGVELANLGLAESWFYILTVSLWMLQSAVLFSAVDLARRMARSNRGSLSDIESTPSVDRFGSELDFERREFANQLHGEVQSRMLSLALRKEGDDLLKRELVIAELKLIERLLSESKHAEELDADQALKLLAAQWDGIAKVQFEFSALPTPVINRLILRIVEQAIANAVRHGMADEILVRFSTLPDGSEKITVADNGIGPVEGADGLGFRFFASHSRKFSLSPGRNGGAVLEALL